MRLNKNFRFVVLPWQTQGLLDRVGLTAEQTMAAAWFADEEGKLFRGAEAINKSLEYLGGVYKLISLMYYVPGLKQIEDWVYRWVAANRYKLPGSTAACQVPQPKKD
jgi:predicted DCC family thiol-disulfide oxidoreductase YuxK